MFLKLEELSTEQKIGMLLCARRFWNEDVDFIIELIKNHSLGSVQFPAWKTEIVKKIKEAADYPIIIVGDVESGHPNSALPKIPMIALAAAGKKEYFRAFAKGVVRDAMNDNFNGAWGPVIDIVHQDSPCMVYRCFSDDADKIGAFAEEIARVYNQNHYFSCGKHYPGGAGSEDEVGIDSHMAGSSVHVSAEELINKNFKPYLHLMEKGLLPTIMVGHQTYANIDPDYPASLSKKVIDLIRNKGFDGVSFTDSFAMLAILQKFGEENIYGMAIAAGNDIVLPNYCTSVKDSYNMLLKNYHDGVFSKERLDEAVRRVLTLQEFVGTEPKTPTEFTDEDEKLVNAVARDCITAVCDDGITAALPQNGKKRLFIVLTENEFNADGPKEEISEAKWYFPKTLAEKILQEFPDAHIEFLKEFSAARDNDKVLRAATNAEEVVFISFCTTACYLGTDCLTRRTESVINALVVSEKLETIVHFGNPFALKPLKHIPRKIFGYNIPDSQKYAIEVLSGKLEANGTLPLNIEYK